MTDTRLSDAHTCIHEGETERAESLSRAVLEDRPDSPHAAALLFLSLALQDRLEDAQPFLQNALASPTPQSADALSDLGFALFLNGEQDQAADLYEQAINTAKADGATYNRLAALRLMQGDLDAAERLFREGLVRDPDRAAIHSNLGGVFVRQDKLENALAQYNRALALDPGLTQAQQGRAAVLIALERLDDEIDALEKELSDHDKPVDVLRRLAHILIHADRYQEADDRLREAWALSPESADIALEIGLLYLRQDMFIAAARVFEKAIERDPELLAARVLQIRAFVESGHFPVAEQRLTALEVETPNDYAVRLARAELLMAQENHQEAQNALNAIINDFPGSAEALSLRGNTRLWAGDIDAAAKDFERAAQLNPLAMAALVQAKRIPDRPEILDQLETLASLPLLPTPARASMRFALAQSLDKTGSYEAAFEQAGQANQLIRQTAPYDHALYSRHIDHIIEAFSPALFERLEHAGLPSSRPVFVVGLPRSGTTLTEQIIASHADAFGAGELATLPAVTFLMPAVLKDKRPYPACMDGFTDRTARHGASYYLDRLGRINDTAARVIDKMPHNFQDLGLIALLFPNAKIIHVNRDPRDVAVSNYFINFKNARGGMGFAYDLSDIGHMINDHDRIMEHWRAVLPIPIYELSYETLVDDFENEARALLDFVGLPWDDGVMAFHKTKRPVKTASVTQVRQPLYTSSKARWKRYEKHLGPLLDVLKNMPQ